MPQDALIIVIALLAAGALTGFLAGVFGVGGGTVVVPVLYEIFGFLEIPESVRIHLAIGTSLAVILPTSLASFRFHQKLGAIDMAVLRAWAVPINIGVFAGVIVMLWLPGSICRAVFAALAFLAASRVLMGHRLPQFSGNLPTGRSMSGYGLAIGATSVLMGIGGGIVSNLIMTLHGRSLHQAVATSSGIGVLVALPGAIGFMLAGWGNPALPPFSAGFVSLVALGVLTPASVVFARFGASIVRGISKVHLEVAFAIYLLAIALRFAVSLA